MAIPRKLPQALARAMSTFALEWSAASQPGPPAGSRCPWRKVS